MKLSTRLGLLSAAVVAMLSGSSLSAGLTPGQEQDFLQNTHVIVVLRDQLPNVPLVRGALTARSSGVAAAQTPVLSELQQSGATRIRPFNLINAIATTVSKAEAARLAAHPLVQAVLPDMAIRALPHANSAPAAGGQGSAAAGTAESIGASSASSASGALCNTLEPEALQLTHAAFENPATPQAQRVLDGNGQYVTGKGVKVAFIADGLDTNVRGFIRPDGSNVFFDYQDFSGDPAGTPTPGGEAFGDASSIAAQDYPNGKPLYYDISRFVNPAHPLHAPCNIRIRGMAPGASLSGLKVFSNLGLTTTSAFVQAIEWAVINDHVDVINESFGGSPFPDTANDPISLANRAAVRAGVTVVVSTGDAGTAGTLGSPSTDADVIAVGGSTSYRLYAQTGSGALPLGSGGYINDNITPLSSGGFAQTRARTVDVVAPGDSGWALCSTNTALYTDCVNNAGKPSAIEDFGGTSQSSPLTAGEAALVIQAYRSAHRGEDPTPARVKQIIMSTATDLGAPASEQGAGLINALGAVNAALFVAESNERPSIGHGHGIVFGPTQANVTGLPEARQTRSFTVLNTGTTVQRVRPSLQALAPPFAGATVSLQLDPSRDPTFLNSLGAARSYISHTFRVPAGAQHLDAAIAFQTPAASSATPIVYFALLDPQGRQTTYSIPQGFGSGYGHVDVTMPRAGIWTAFVWTRPTGVAGSYAGPVEFTWGVERYATVGSVWPERLELPPGASARITAQFALPAEPGDAAAAIRFEPLSSHASSAASAGLAEIPVTMSTLIPMEATGASFTGTLTGGNGRPNGGPTQTFAFDVPRGVQTMSLNLEIADSGYLLEGLLVDPNGMQLSVEPNLDPTGKTSQYALQLFRYNPQPGRWRFVLLQNFTSSGNQTSLPFTARIGLDTTGQFVSANLPNSPGVRLSAGGAPVTIPVHVRNHGAATQFYFADARLSTRAAVQLPTSSACTNPYLQGACDLVYVPTQVSAIRFVAQSTTPINMDVFNYDGYGVGIAGAPDLWARPTGPGAVEASLLVPEVPYGPWILAPSLIGPYGPGGATTTQPVATGAVALMQPFDPAVSADSGDIWADLTLSTQTFNPLLLGPGATGTINVTFKPDPAQVGKTVSGYLYIDTFNFAVSTGDEVVRIPYTYTVVP